MKKHWTLIVPGALMLSASPAWAACIAAAYLKLWAGNTRSSWSAVVTITAGYFVPGFTLWYGEYA